jgi:hypothetical protein
MNPTDQAIEVFFRAHAQAEERRGIVKLQNNCGNTILTFFHNVDPRATGPLPRRKFPPSPEFSHYLFNFIAFEIDPKNSLAVKLSSPTESCSFCCASPAEFGKLTDYLCQKVGFVHSSANPALFKLQSLDHGESPFLTTLLPNPGKHQDRVSIAGVPVPEVRPVEISHETLHRDTLFNSIVSPSIVFDVFKFLLPPLEFQADASYRELKHQWSSVSRAQFQNNLELPQLMRFVQNEILKTPDRYVRFTNPRQVQKSLFNLMVTYTVYNWDGAAYNTSLLDLLWPFVDSYLEQNGETFEDLEGEVFPLFVRFFETQGFEELKRSQRQTFIHPLLVQVGETIQAKFPDLLDGLIQKNVFTLDFLRNDLSRWFLDVFKLGDLKVLWISILTFERASEFFESFIIALLLTVVSQVDELNPLDADEFAETFNSVKAGLGLRTLLATTAHVNKVVRGTGEG